MRTVALAIALPEWQNRVVAVQRGFLKADTT